jgi:hypothetical protein
MDALCFRGIILWKEYSFRVVMKRSIETNSSSLKLIGTIEWCDNFSSSIYWITIDCFINGQLIRGGWLGCVICLGFICYNSIFRPALGEIMDEHFMMIWSSLLESLRPVEGIIDTKNVIYVNQGWNITLIYTQL